MVLATVVGAVGSAVRRARRCSPALRYLLVAALAGAGLATPLIVRAQGTGTGTPPAGAGNPPAATGDTPPKKDEEKDPNSAEEVAKAKFIESYTAGDFAKAEGFYKQLITEFPTNRTDTSYAYKYGYSLFRVGKKKESYDALIALLGQDSENVLAMFLIAEIEATTDDAAVKEAWHADAKDRLLNAAKNGFFTIREIMQSKTKEFDYLRTDSKFILDAMRASREFNVSVKKGQYRNPFEYPPDAVKPKEDLTVDPNQKTKIDPVRMAELEKKIQAIFDKIAKLAKENKVDELIPVFAELRGLMSDYGKEGGESAQKQLAKYEKQLTEYKEVYLAVQLQIDISRGNEFLKAMIRANQAEKFEDTFEKFGGLKNLVEEMRKRDRDEFHRNADAFLIRGKGLNDEAVKLKKIKEFNLVVTGIIVDPSPQGKNKGIIVFDDPDGRGKIYEVGDTVRYKDDRRVKGLTIVAITPGSIGFKYDDTDFVRELKRPKE